VSVNALLKARARALAKGEKTEAAELRAELAKVAIVTRDDKTGQSWRYARSPPPA
jgi:cysteinyl-tRNA synthetase